MKEQYVARILILNDSTRTGRYVPVCQHTGTRIAYYRAVPSIGTISALEIDR